MIEKSNNEVSLNFKIERSNEFNQLKPKGMTLTDIRFLAIYQSKINARKPDTRTVSFSLEEFCRIMDIKQLNITQLKNTADNIICKPVHLPDGNGGLYVVPLFNKCYIKVDEKTGKWIIEIRCSEEVLPYMFNMKRNYFTYELWNALKLKSINQVRMYEILKQYEKIGNRVITIEELKELLGIGKNQYVEYKIFRRDVLEVCQKALEQYTDIKYTFEPIRRGRKIYALKFTITRNKGFKDDLRLKEFIKPEDLEDIKDIFVETVENTVESQYSTVLQSLYYRCGKAYTLEQLEMISDYINNSGVKLNVSTENYIYSVYANIKIKGNKVNNLFRYTFSVIEKQINEYIFAPNKQKEEEMPQERKSSYNMEDFNTTKRWVGEEDSKEDDFDEIINSGVIPFD